jgi:hypothetical protein
MRAALAARELTDRNPIRGTFVGCCASDGSIGTRRIAESSQKSFGFMAGVFTTAMDLPQSKRNETDIFGGVSKGESGESTQESIRFDSPTESVGVHLNYRSTVLNSSANRYPAKYILRFAISLASAA